MLNSFYFYCQKYRIVSVHIHMIGLLDDYTRGPVKTTFLMQSALGVSGVMFKKLYFKEFCFIALARFVKRRVFLQTIYHTCSSCDISYICYACFSLKGWQSSRVMQRSNKQILGNILHCAWLL